MPCSDEALGVLAADERLDGVAERVIGTRADVDDRVDDHGKEDDADPPAPTVNR